MVNKKVIHEEMGAQTFLCELAQLVLTSSVTFPSMGDAAAEAKVLGTIGAINSIHALGLRDAQCRCYEGVKGRCRSTLVGRCCFGVCTIMFLSA